MIRVEAGGASTGAASYQLFRDTSAGGSFDTQVYTGSDLSFTDSPLASSTTCCYKGIKPSFCCGFRLYFRGHISWMHRKLPQYLRVPRSASNRTPFTTREIPGLCL